MTAAFMRRNIQLFFKDKGTLISAMIAPLVILMLYILFLHGVLKSTITSNLPAEFVPSEQLLNGYIAAYEISSILAVCCVTVAFVANMAMVDDRVSGVRCDLDVTPVKKSVLTLGYYFSTAAITLAICYITMCAGFVYLAVMGWQLSVADVFFVILDVFLASMFGTALSSVVCHFLKSKGAINAVSVIVSSVYGFICGAYYPISQFSSGIANAVMCLPGTYCTGLFRSHFMLPYASAFGDAGLPSAAIDVLSNIYDAHMSFFGADVPVWAMYTVVAVSIVAFVGIFVLLNVLCGKMKAKKKAK